MAAIALVARAYNPRGAAAIGWKKTRNIMGPSGTGKTTRTCTALTQ